MGKNDRVLIVHYYTDTYVLVFKKRKRSYENIDAVFHLLDR